MVQEELGRLESCREAGTSGYEHHGSPSATEGVAAAALLYFKKLGHLASCTADIRWALQKSPILVPMQSLLHCPGQCKCWLVYSC